VTRLLSFLLCFFAAGVAPAASIDDLLEPEKAFRMSVSVLDATTVEVKFAIADGYYMYRERFRFALDPGSTATLGAPQFPPGTRKKDEFFGEVETYRKQVVIRLPVENADAPLHLTVTSQGCADVGVCYIPMDSKATIQLAGYSVAPGGAPPSPGFTVQISDFEVARLFQSGGPLLVLASFLGFGLLLAFTPCVLPMIPILSGIIAGEGRELGKLRALLLSGAYVLGMALTYAVAGVAAAWSGTLLAAALQNAWVLSAFALVFVVLAF
jgi:thiol:disulfide interchange protein DsbD